MDIVGGVMDSIQTIGGWYWDAYSGAWEFLGGEPFSSPESLLSSAISAVIGAISFIVVLGVGVYVLFTLIIGKFQFYIGFLFGPIGLVLLPLDKGKVLSSSISMMLAGLTVFAVAFAVMLVSINVFAESVEKLSAAAIANGEGGGFKVMFSIATMLYSFIMYLIVKNSVSWGSELFGSFGFDMRSVVRGIASGGRMTGAAASTVGRGAAGATGGAISGGTGAASSSEGGVKGALKGALKKAGGIASGAFKGGFQAARGRSGALSRREPKMGSGMRLSDSFSTGKSAGAPKSKVSKASSDILSKK